MVDNSLMDNKKKIFVGAYALSPTLLIQQKKIEEEFYKKLASRDLIFGLELPFYGDGFHPFGDDSIEDLFNPNWSFSITTLPGNMNNLKEDPSFGLASDNSKGRIKAIDFIKKCIERTNELNHRKGFDAAGNIQITSSPRIPKEGVTSSVECLTRSLEELSLEVGTDLTLTLEHCDSFNSESNEVPQKGFMSLSDEISAIKNLNSKDIKVLVNWGRSAIEMKSVEGPIDHIRTLKNEGLLKGIIFSGTGEISELYGNWSDLHLPMYSEKVPSLCKDSLMTESEIKRCLEIADISTIEILGAKILRAPITESTLEQRLGCLDEILEVISSSISQTK